LNFKNSKKQGDYGLGSAIAYFTRRSYTVAIPLTDSQDYDLIIDDNGTLKKVQVKTTSQIGRTKSTYIVELRLIGGSLGDKVQKYANELDYDILYVITKSGEEYLIPKSALIGVRSSIVVGNKWNEYRVSGAVGEAQQAVTLLSYD